MAGVRRSTHEGYPRTPHGQGDLDLRPPIAEVQRGGNERQGLLLGLAHQLVDLGSVHQQLALPVRVVGAHPGGELPRRDVELEEPELPVVDPGVGLAELGLAFAERLDLGALEDLSLIHI